MSISPRSPGGFTLIELLVLVAIIAVLASLLMPAAGMVFSRARSVRCLNNLRQLQMANFAYASDWEGSYVPSFRYDVGGGWSLPWIDNQAYVDLLVNGANDKFKANYAGSLNIQQLCPLSKRNTITSQIGTSYGYNHGMKSIPSYRPAYIGSRDGEAGIGNRVAFIDALSYKASLSGADPTNYWIGGMALPEGTVTNNTVAYRHHGKANVVYYDGHVATEEPVTIFVSDLWYAP